MSNKLLPAAKKPQLTRITSESQVVGTVNNLVAAMQLLAGQNQDKLEQAVTFKDLRRSGFSLASLGDGSFDVVPPGNEADVPDLTVPPAMTGVRFETTLTSVLVFWDVAGYKRHAYVEIWVAEATKKVDAIDVPTVLSDAHFHGTCPTTAIAIALPPGDSIRIWLRNVGQNTKVGPWYDIAGTMVTVPENPSYLLDKISGEIRETHLYSSLGQKIDNSAQKVIEYGLTLASHATTLDSHYNTLVSQGSTITAQGATIVDLQSVVSGQGQTIASHGTQLNSQGSSITSLSQLVNTQGSTIASHGTSIQTLNSSVTSLSQVNETQNNTLASHTNSISSFGTSIQSLSSITTEHDRLLDASYTLRIDTGGAVHGFGLAVDGTTNRSDFVIRADRFAIAAPQQYDVNGKPIVHTAAFPFIVDATDVSNPKVLIKDAYISSAYIESLVANKVNASYVNAMNLSAVNISGGRITIGNNFNVDVYGNMTCANAFFKGTAQSSNFMSGSAGWRVLNSGSAEFNDAVVRGAVYATDGWFKGTVYADRIVGDVCKIVSAAAPSNVVTIAPYTRARTLVINAPWVRANGSSSSYLVTIKLFVNGVNVSTTQHSTAGMAAGAYAHFTAPSFTMDIAANAATSVYWTHSPATSAVVPSGPMVAMAFIQ